VACERVKKKNSDTSAKILSDIHSVTLEPTANHQIQHFSEFKVVGHRLTLC